MRLNVYVADLKEKITEKCHIPIEQQVLLISGGEPLDSSKNLCSYMAGTDTNPIYLFSTNYDVSKLDVSKHLQFDDEELRKRLIDARCLPCSVNTVKIRTLLAQDFAHAAKVQLEFCENLVHDQHLQQQGWFAVIANLEDIVMEFRKRWELFQKMYEEFIADRDTYDNFLLSFENDKQILQRIPVIETLLDSKKYVMEDSKSEIANSMSESELDKEITLYDWISSDNKNSLDGLYELCKSSLSKFEKEILPSLKKQIDDTLLTAEKPERKEIEGLGKRLCDLDDLVRKVKSYVENQTTMARSFLQHQQSVVNVKDNSVLPDLSVSHMHQLTIILEAHDKLMEDRNRIIKAKYELSKSLCTRIGWVQTVEDKLWELDNLLVYFHEHLQRLRKHLEVFQQLHVAPIIYMNAIVEVVRRRLFSQLFLLWASDLACQQLTIYNEEVTRRKDFNSLFEGHFLSTLFPGMSDIPPAFATEAPSRFDAQLPNVSAEDIERLRKQFPEFLENLTVPDMSHVMNFFSGKNSGKEKDDKVDDAFGGIEDKLIQAVSDVGLASNLDKNMLKTGSESCLVSAPGLPTLKDDKGCESETDTEEFEKLGQSPMELAFPQGILSGADSKVSEKIDASTITEENLEISRLEHEKLKNIVLNLSGIAKLATKNLRTDLNNIKVQFETESLSLSKQYEELGSSWETLLVEVDRNEKEIVQCLRQECDEQKEQYRYNLMEKEDLIERIDYEKRKLEERLEYTTVKMLSLEEILAKQNMESTREIDTLKQQLHQKELDHRTELDNIKSRFKLMTMEKSPSLNSLEKERSSDCSSMPTNSTLLMQMTENFELDKENAVAEERKRWENILEKKIKERCDVLSQEIAQRISEDKDNQIDALRRRENNLNLMIVKYKTTIQQLTESEGQRESELCEEFEQIKSRIRGAISRADFVHGPMTTSITAAERNNFEDTSSALTKSELGTGRPDDLNLDGWTIPSIVLIFWDEVYKNYHIYQHSKKHLYFLHYDSLVNLGLNVVKGRPNKVHCIGEVVDMDFCQAMKETNRFNVPNGTKFFLVKVKPVTAFRESLESPQMPNVLYNAFEKEETDSTIATDVIQPDADICAIEQPEQVISRDIEKQLAQDSVIVDSIEQPVDDSDRMYEYRTLQHEQSSETEIVQLLFENQNKFDYEEIESLKRDNQQLKDELARLTSEKDALMTTFVAVYEGKLDASRSSVEAFPPISDMSRSEIISPRPHRLSIDSCKIGDVVLLLWNQVHENFKVMQETRHTYFPHSDSLEILGLTITEGKPNRMYCLGEVVKWDYCQARKSDNRYKVPKGAKFFRVKLKPISSSHRDRDLSQSTYSTKQAFTMSTSHSETTSFDPLPEETSQDSTSDLPTIISGSSANLEECQLIGDLTTTVDTKTDIMREDEPSDECRLEDLRPEELNVNTEKHFAEDSDIEEATAAIEHIDRVDEYRTLQHEQSSETEIVQLLFENQNKFDYEEIESLKRDNQQLKDELARLTSEKDALMTTSVAVYEGKLDASTSPMEAFPPISDMSRSEIISPRPHRLSIDSCKIGDVVLLLWNQVHEYFKVLQETRHTYFPHSDSLEKLGLTITEGKPNRMYCLGEVLDREYCQAKKSDNRYKVPKGTKFFRVKLKPISSSYRDRDLSQSTYSSKQAFTMSTSHSVTTTFDPLPEETSQDNASDLPTIISGSSGNLEECQQIVDLTKTVDTKTDMREDEPSVECRWEDLQPDELNENTEKHFAEDSGIEEATAAIEHIDRYEGDSCNQVAAQATYNNTNWFEAMFRSMFSK